MSDQKDTEEFPKLFITIHKGSASDEDIEELLEALSDLYKAFGGSDIVFKDLEGHSE